MGGRNLSSQVVLVVVVVQLSHARHTSLMLWGRVYDDTAKKVECQFLSLKVWIMGPPFELVADYLGGSFLLIVPASCDQDSTMGTRAGFIDNK